MYLRIAAAIVMLVCSCNAVAEDIGVPSELAKAYKPGDRYMRVRLLGTIRLLNTPVGGLGASEISALAWDEDEEVLYAVSDQGHLLHIRPRFREGFLTGAELEGAYPLRGRGGVSLERKYRDAEGAALRNGANGIKGDGEILIAFEIVPRIDRYRPSGEWLGTEPLNAALRQDDYQRGNNGLESVALLSGVGYVTAPEKPLKSALPGELSLYGQNGAVWTFPPIDPQASTIAGLETDTDGRILVLERRYKNLFLPVIFAIRRLTLPPQGGAAAVEEVARFSTAEQWFLDNFEAIARHRGNRYFMASDDNNSAMQKTLLLYLEILD